MKNDIKMKKSGGLNKSNYHGQLLAKEWTQSTGERPYVGLCWSVDRLLLNVFPLALIVTDEGKLSETIQSDPSSFFLMDVFFAFKGSKLVILIFITAAGVVP